MQNFKKKYCVNKIQSMTVNWFLLNYNKMNDKINWNFSYHIKWKIYL